MEEKEIRVRAETYEGARIRQEETERETARQKRLSQLRARFVHGPVLLLPLLKMSFSFDPGSVQSLPEFGTVYRTMEVSDVWGVLTVTSDGLIESDWSRIRVPAPADGSARPRRATAGAWS